MSHAAAVLEPGLLVTVWAGRRRLDVELPPVPPVAELVPALARRLGVLDEAAAHGCRLLDASGRSLDPSSGLAAQEVEPGVVLSLVVGEPSPPELYDDPAEAVASVSPPPMTDPSAVRLTSLAVSALCLGALWLHSTGLIVPTCLALLLLTGATLLGARWHSAALGLVWVAAAFAGVAGARIDGSAAWLGAGLGAGLAGLLGIVALVAGRRWLLPLLAMSTTVALVGVAELVGVHHSVAGSVGLLLSASGPALLPRLAAALAGEPGQRLDAPLARRWAADVRGLFDALTTGVTSAVVVLVVVLAPAGRPGAPLVAMSGLLLMLRSRGSNARLVSGVIGGTWCLLAAASMVDQAYVAAAVPVLIPVGALIAPTVRRPWSATALRLRARTETAVLVVLPVSALLAAGTLDGLLP